MGLDRVRYNFMSGTITDNPLSATGNASLIINSLGFTSLPDVLSGKEVLAITLDPLGTAPEIVWVTAHAPGATPDTFVKVLRGQEGTTAIQHAYGTPWVHGPTAADYPNLEGNKIVQMWNFK